MYIVDLLNLWTRKIYPESLKQPFNYKLGTEKVIQTFIWNLILKYFLRKHKAHGCVRLGYSGIRIYSGIVEFFVCLMNDY